MFKLKLVAALSLSILLTSCLQRVEVDSNAPELERRYVLTETLVLSAMKMTLPTFGQPLRVAPYVMTRPYFKLLTQSAGSLSPEVTERGTVQKNSHVRVKKLFTSYSPDGSTRQADLQFTDPATGKQTTAYATWSDVEPKLEEQLTTSP